MTDQEVYDDILTRLYTTRAITPEVVGELLDLSKRLIGEIESQKMGIEGMKAYCEIRDSNMQPLLDANHKLNEEIAELKGALLIACDDMTIYDEDRLIQPREHVYLPQAYLDRAKQDRVLFKEATANE